MDKSPFKVNVEETSDKLLIRFSGQLIINHINKITEELRPFLTVRSDVDIIIDNADNIDVTFIQLVYSIKNTYLAQNKKVSITAKLKEELETLVSNSGFNLLQN